MTENGGDLFVKENTKGEAAKKMFDGELCSLQVFIILCEMPQFHWMLACTEGTINQHNSSCIPSGTMGYRGCQGS